MAEPVRYNAICQYCGKKGTSTTTRNGPPTIHPPSPQMGCPNSPDKRHRFKWERE